MSTASYNLLRRRKQESTAMARRLSRLIRAAWKDYPVPSALALLVVLLYLAIALPQAAKVFPGAGMLVLFAWFVLRAPNVCGAITKEGKPCRRNAKGLLGGCHLIEHKRQHVLQRLKATSTWAGPRLRETAKSTIEILGALGSFVGGIYGVLSYLRG
ncbi:MAG: hypothetical protein R2761_09655 [Acidimicrobiales bacterium]